MALACQHFDLFDMLYLQYDMVTILLLDMILHLQYAIIFSQSLINAAFLTSWIGPDSHLGPNHSFREHLFRNTYIYIYIYSYLRVLDDSFQIRPKTLMVFFPNIENTFKNYWNMFKVQISTLTDNHTLRKNFPIDKKYFLRKMGLKFRSPNLNILSKIALYFLL